MSLTEITFTNDKEVSCDGSKTVDNIIPFTIPGHPKVYLNMGKKDHVICPYCNRRFTNRRLNYVTNILNSSS